MQSLEEFNFNKAGLFEGSFFLEGAIWPPLHFILQEELI